MSSAPLTPHDHAEALVKQLPTLGDLNEADTRHQIIDCVLHNIFEWPRPAVSCESYIDPGYADYVLLGRHDRQLLFIEAKKAGYFFNLPPKYSTQGHFRYLAVRTLLTDKDVAAAIQQVRNYCLNEGCEHAAITNGVQWIFFKTFEKSQDWRKLQAFIVEDPAYFNECYIEAASHFSYSAIVSRASLATLFGDSPAGNRPRYFPKEKVVAYDHEVLSNHLAPPMRPLIDRYFGRLDARDAEFMDRCYVNNREYHVSELNVKQLIDDLLSPYFRDYSVKDFFDDPDGGAFGHRIDSSARERRTQDVIVLFGGKGSGKSTFVNRLLYHRPPNSIKFFTKVAIVDLLECPENQEQIDDETWTQLLNELDADGFLIDTREVLLRLFDDRYQVALRQSLVGLPSDGEAYNLKLNTLVESWKADKQYCAAKLADHWKRMQKGCIVVLDNTDQFSPKNQDYSFTLAHKIASQLDCLVVISMREERFHHSRLHGTLDAFTNSGFHLSSPPPARVFARRLAYVLRILDNPTRTRKVAPELSDEQIANVKILFRIFLREFRSDDSHLQRFVRACAHGNMRLALQFFRQFVLSGYLRVDEMIEEPRWTLQMHQVLRPMMVPYRLFYDESKSSVPNVYQIRSETMGSHFTGVRILKMLRRGTDALNPDYVPMSRLKAYFAETFNMLDDAQKTLDVFLKGGVVESNNRVDEFDDSIDAVRITAFGSYICDTLAHNFSYLDLVSLDCGVHEQGTADALAAYGNKDRDLFFEGKKHDRIHARVEKVRVFLDYLQREEEIERDVYTLDANDERIMDALRAAYDDDERRVLRSAGRNYSPDDWQAKEDAGR